MFTHLFDTYGDITTEDLTTFRARLEGLRFPTNKPVDTIVAEVENYEKLCGIAESPLTCLEHHASTQISLHTPTSMEILISMRIYLHPLEPK